jgi:hypothetical protein
MVAYPRHINCENPQKVAVMMMMILKQALSIADPSGLSETASLMD